MRTLAAAGRDWKRDFKSYPTTFYSKEPVSLEASFLFPTHEESLVRAESQQTSWQNESPHEKILEIALFPQRPNIRAKTMPPLPRSPVFLPVFLHVCLNSSHLPAQGASVLLTQSVEYTVLTQNMSIRQPQE